VLEASSTKWNFLNFRPGLVGGHCIGVDPYYLTYLAEGVGFHPQLIQAGRRINDGMASFIAQKAISLIINSGQKNSEQLHVGICGVTFKENVPDIRNTKVVDLALALEAFGVRVSLVDPIADPGEFEHEYGRSLTPLEDLSQCNALILAVKHQYFADKLSLQGILSKLHKHPIILDLKGVLDLKEASASGATVWRL
jgi:UDP-N-acetyl-D-galactosamine dehydrogenase